MNWNDDWRQELEAVNEDCYCRLCECRNTKADMRLMVQLMTKYNAEKNVINIVDRVIEWVTGWNNQIYLIPDNTEYEKLLRTALKVK